MKNKKEAMTQKQYQGDVLIKPIAIPINAKIKPWDGTLAHGEVTGHRHAVRDYDPAHVQMLQFETKTYLRLLKDVEIVHEEHNKLILPKGDYEYSGTLEYDYDTEESKRVAD